MNGISKRLTKQSRRPHSGSSKKPSMLAFLRLARQEEYGRQKDQQPTYQEFMSRPGRWSGTLRTRSRSDLRRDSEERIHVFRRMDVQGRYPYATFQIE